MISLKSLVDNHVLTSIPPTHAHFPASKEPIAPVLQDSIPTIDLSLLSSELPDLRSRAVQELGRVCEEWGCFSVINHGVSENLVKAMIDECVKFFNLPEEEKRVYVGKHVLDPISELASEYSKRVREVALKLLGGISESLGLEESYIQNALNMQKGLQVMVANFYPPCPQPKLGMGLGSHTDHGLITLLVQNGIGGLQIQHQGKWVPVTPKPNSFFVNTSDQIEILSKGKYNSVVHRAVVNDKVTRISIGSLIASPLDAIVGPSVYLTDGEKNPPAYAPMTYREFLELQQSNCVDGKSSIDRVKIV